MSVDSIIHKRQEAKDSLEQGSKILYSIAGFLMLLVTLVYINSSQFNLNYLTPFVLVGLIYLVNFNMSKILSLILLVFPSLVTINVLINFDLNGSFWLVAPPFILQIIFICLFYYGSFKVIEGVFAYHRLKNDMGLPSNSLGSV